MAQDYTIDSFVSSHDGKSDLQVFENNFEVLRSMFSGTTEPSAKTAGQPWYDLTNRLLRIRNSSNSSWSGVMAGKVDSKLWLYTITSPDGWVRENISDVLLALRGGNTSYNVQGAQLAGSWGLSATVTDHIHKWYIEVDPGTDKTFDINGNQISVKYTKGQAGWHAYVFQPSGASYCYMTDSYTKPQTTSSGSVGNDWRPQAAIGGIFYPNI